MKEFQDSVIKKKRKVDTIVGREKSRKVENCCKLERTVWNH